MSDIIFKVVLYLPIITRFKQCKTLERKKKVNMRQENLSVRARKTQKEHGHWEVMSFKRKEQNTKLVWPGHVMRRDEECEMRREMEMPEQ